MEQCDKSGATGCAAVRASEASKIASNILKLLIFVLPIESRVIVKKLYSSLLSSQAATGIHSQFVCICPGCYATAVEEFSGLKECTRNALTQTAN